MITLVMMFRGGYEMLRLKGMSISEEMGKSSFGKSVIKYMSGWLYVREGYSVMRDGQQIASPFAPTVDCDYILTGNGYTIALSVRNDSGQNLHASIEGVDSFSIGRDNKNDIVYKDPLVSGWHARVSLSARNELIYTDMSQNGSYVDGVFIKGDRRILKPNSTVLIPPLLNLTFGENTLTFNTPENLKTVKLKKVQ